MSKTIPNVQIRSSLGKKIPGDGTIFINQSSKSPIIGECIYCGETEGLTDEHSIPYALFGAATLKKATCKVCAGATQKIEQRVLRDTFGQVREYLKFPSRKAKKNGTWIGRRRGFHKKTGEALDEPLENGPVMLFMAYPDYQPRLLLNTPFEKSHGLRKLATIHLNPVTELPHPSFEDSFIKFNPSDLERCIAKIALCEAIRIIDPTIRDRRVANFIINGTEESSSFLGAVLNHDVSDNMHKIEHQMLRGRTGEQVWVSYVRLFDFLPTPRYSVVIRPNPSPDVK